MAQNRDNGGSEDAGGADGGGAGGACGVAGEGGGGIGENAGGVGGNAGKNVGGGVSLARRVAAMFYDALFVFAVLALASLPWSVAGITPEHPLYPVYMVFLYALIAGYFTWFWTHGGQTPGMKTWKILLVADGGGAVGWHTALLRFAAAMLSLGALGLGFIAALFNDERLAWHDRLSASRLVASDK